MRFQSALEAVKQPVENMLEQAGSAPVLDRIVVDRVERSIGLGGSKRFNLPDAKCLRTRCSGMLHQPKPASR